MININRIRRGTALVLAATATTALVAGAASTAAAATTTRSVPRATAATTTRSVPRATAADVRITVKPIKDGAAAGHSYLDLVYHNISGHTVSIDGYSGLSIVAHRNGTRVGEPAIWLTNRRPRRVLLEQGATTVQIISVADALNYGSAKQTVRADGFRVYLPGSRSAIFVPYRLTATTKHVAQLQEDPIGARI